MSTENSGMVDPSPPKRSGALPRVGRLSECINLMGHIFGPGRGAGGLPDGYYIVEGNTNQRGGGKG